MAFRLSEVKEAVKAITTDNAYASYLISMAIELELPPESLAELFKCTSLEELGKQLPSLQVLNEVAMCTSGQRSNLRLRFDPKHIIRFMIYSHKKTNENIQTSGKDAESITTQITVNRVSQEFTFSMNNSFVEDIQFICLSFLSRGTLYDKLLGREKFIQCIKMLKKKYNIITKRTPGSYLNKTSITFLRIAASFSCITVDLFHKGCGKSIVDGLQLFPEHNLPRAIFSPMIASTLPKQDDSPLAVILAIAVKADDVLYKTDAKTRLTALYQHLLAWYNSTGAPEKLKMMYCEDWELGKRRNATFIYSDVVIGARQRAKDIIRSSRPADQALDEILNLI